jgi:hypothetical protein
VRRSAGLVTITVLLPVATNVATEKLPAVIKDHAGFAWLVIVAVAAWLGLKEWESRPAARALRTDRLKARLAADISRALNARRPRPDALPWISLSIVERPDGLLGPDKHLTVQQILHPEPPRPRAVDKPVDMLRIFQEAKRALLLLGEPGAGKSTLAAYLAEALMQLHRSQEDEPIPVVLSLSTWTKSSGTVLASWMAGQLHAEYNIPRAEADELIADGSLVPILDGLD